MDCISFYCVYRNVQQSVSLSDVSCPCPLPYLTECERKHYSKFLISVSHAVSISNGLSCSPQHLFCLVTRTRTSMQCEVGQGGASGVEQGHVRQAYKGYIRYIEVGQGETIVQVIITQIEVWHDDIDQFVVCPLRRQEIAVEATHPGRMVTYLNICITITLPC